MQKIDFNKLIDIIINFKDKCIIEFGHQLGVGKTFISGKLITHLQEIYGYKCYYSCFAAPLKKILTNLKLYKNLSNTHTFKIDNKKFIELLYNDIIKYTNRYIDNDLIYNKIIDNQDKILEYLNLYKKRDLNGYRKLSQLIGAEIIRPLNENFLKVYIENDISNLKNYFDCFIIDDYRYPNEILNIKDLKTMLIKVECSKDIVAKRLNISLNQLSILRNHGSENNNLKFDFSINNDKDFIKI